MIEAHKGPVLQVQWTRDGDRLYSCSADMQVALWDATTGERLRRFKGHKAIVNACSSNKRGQEMIASVGDDGCLKIWDTRQKVAVKSFDESFPLTSVAFGLDGGLVFAAGINNQIKAWDLRKDAVGFELSGHYDTVTGLATSPNGDYLLSNGMDNTGLFY